MGSLTNLKDGLYAHSFIFCYTQKPSSEISYVMEKKNLAYMIISGVFLKRDEHEPKSFKCKVRGDITNVIFFKYQCTSPLSNEKSQDLPLL